MPTPLSSLPVGFGLSVVAHVGLIAVAVRGPAARLVASAEAPESRIEIEVTAPPEAEASDPTVEEGARPAIRSSQARRHHHPYAVPRDHDAVPHDPRVVHERAATTAPSEAPIGRPASSTDDELDRAPAPRFLLAAVEGPSAAHRLRAAGGAAVAGPDEAGARGDAGAGDVVPESGVTSRARLVSSAPPAYPPAARRAEVEADVPLEIVVDAAGRVTSAAALGRAGFGLDEAARIAVAGYRFSPALRDGRPVRVRMRWVVQFRLR